MTLEERIELIEVEQQMLTLLASPDRGQRARVVLDWRASEPVLMVAVRDEDAGIRAMAAVHRNASENVQLVAAGDQNPMVRRALVEHLAWEVRMHRPVSRLVLKVLADDPDERVARIAREALYWLRIGAASTEW